MGKAVVLAGLMLVVASGTASPALAQLAKNAPAPPEYQVQEDGTLVIGGDVLVRCAEVGLGDPYLGADDPEVRAQIERSLRESARACETAGFSTALDAASGGASATPSASASADADGPTGSPASATPQADTSRYEATTLPDTGGLELSLLPLAAVAFLTAGSVLALRAGRLPTTAKRHSRKLG